MLRRHCNQWSENIHTAHQQQGLAPPWAAAERLLPLRLGLSALQQQLVAEIEAQTFLLEAETGSYWHLQVAGMALLVELSAATPTALVPCPGMLEAVLVAASAPKGQMMTSQRWASLLKDLLTKVPVQQTWEASLPK
mmetsp:Transcript_7000/g.15332  ORF Transcript_7000/g.15332 Transcript_7000/m.15332 type:complete len:137 (-) Transcript_7000:1054-1464(-)